VIDKEQVIEDTVTRAVERLRENIATEVKNTKREMYYTVCYEELTEAERDKIIEKVFSLIDISVSVRLKETPPGGPRK
jgi:hypothetical protein